MIVARPVELGRLVVEAEHAAGGKEVSAIAVLTRRLAKGDEEAYREFFDGYSPRLYGYLFVLCRGNAEQARELLQQTMIRVAKYARVFEDEEIFWKWLTALARSCWVDESRKRNRYVAALERLWNRHAHEAGIKDAEAIEGEVAAMVELLGEEDRALLTKKYVEGLPVREIAMTSGCSEKAIESRLARARSRIKEIMQSGRSK